MQCVRNCDSSDPKEQRHFEQPVMQTAQMFVGEMGCWLVVAGYSFYARYSSGRRRRQSGYRPIEFDRESLDQDADRRSTRDDITPIARPLVPNDETRTPLRGWRVLLLSLPACCDITGTTLMNIGLLFVAASIYQMTRGALVLFVGLFSVVFLRRRLRLYQWLALVVVVIGVGIVGLAGTLFKDGVSATDDPRASTMVLMRQADESIRSPEAVRTVVGILLIAAAQIFTASQFVLEEWILEHYALEPLRVVGWEGVFGCLVTVLGMIILHLAVGRTDQGRYGYFDAEEGWRELTQHRSIAVSSVLIMICIGWVVLEHPSTDGFANEHSCFNFFGLSVTHTVSATSRSTIDTSRTLFIWIISLGLGWETFKWLQVLGFALLVYGTFV